MSPCSATHLEPTGWSSATWASTTFLSMKLWRAVISTFPMMTLLRLREGSGHAPGSTATGLLDDRRCGSDGQFGLGVPDDLVAALLGDRVDDQPSAALLLDRPGDPDLLLGKPHAAELDRQPLEPARVAVGDGVVRAGHLGHRVEAVEYHPRQAHALREVLVDVDRIGVAGGVLVALGEPRVGRDLELGYGVAGLHRTMLVQVARTTSSPSWFVETDSKT